MRLKTGVQPMTAHPLRQLTQKLYLRLWLAVVLAVAMLTLLVGAAWQLATEPPPREVILRDHLGMLIGRGSRPSLPRVQRCCWSSPSATSRCTPVISRESSSTPRLSISMALLHFALW